MTGSYIQGCATVHIIVHRNENGLQDVRIIITYEEFK